MASASVDDNSNEMSEPDQDLEDPSSSIEVAMGEPAPPTAARTPPPPTQEVNVLPQQEQDEACSVSVITDIQTVQYEMANRNLYPSAADVESVISSAPVTASNSTTTTNAKVSNVNDVKSEMQTPKSDVKSVMQAPAKSQAATETIEDHSLSSSFFSSIPESVQDLPDCVTSNHDRSHTSCATASTVSSSSIPGAYSEVGGRRRALAPNLQVGRSLRTDRHNNNDNNNTETTQETTLVKAELAPVDYEEIMAERDALRQTMDSIQEAQAVVPMDKQQQQQQQQHRTAWTCRMGCCALCMLLSVVLAVSVTVAAFAGRNNKDTDTASSPSFWKARQIGQTLLGAEAYDEYGEFLSLNSDGTILAVGGEEHDEFKGRVAVYQLDSSSPNKQWHQLFQILGDTPGEESGLVSLSSQANRLAVAGKKASTGRGGEQSGRIRTYQLSLPSQNTTTNDQPQQSPLYQPIPHVLEGTHSYEKMGGDVQFSADGNRMAVGAHGTIPANTTGKEFGSVQVFQLDHNKTSWKPLGQRLYGTNESDFFGSMTALSADGHVLAAGGYGCGTNGIRAGVVRVYRLDLQSLLWKQLGPDFYGEDAGDEIGRSISLSSDGRTVAFGGYRHAESTGRVYVYRWRDEDDDSGVWEPMGQSIDGMEPGDRLGRSVFLSGDGSVLAAGAYWNNDGGDRAGHVRVFYWNSTETMNGSGSWDQVGPPIPGSDGAWFGRRIAMARDGKTLAVGGPFHNSDNGSHAGKVEVFALP